jgi:hypothetical protein
MRVKILGGYLDLDFRGAALQEISERLKKIAQGEAKKEEKRVVGEIFGNEGNSKPPIEDLKDMSLKRPGKKEHLT